MTAAGQPGDPDPGAVVRRLAELRDRIGRLRDPSEVRIVAVTKGFGPGAVRAAHAAGLTDIGENYAAELLAKAAATADLADLRWHFIGAIQRNKVRKLAGTVRLWQSVDRRSAAAEIARRAPGAAVLVQVDVVGMAGGTARRGVPPAEVPALVAGSRDLGLTTVGLMAVGAPGDPEATRRGFRLLRALADDLGLAEVSMGMSDDLEIALEEGTTMIRVGTALFGPRPRR